MQAKFFLEVEPNRLKAHRPSTCFRGPAFAEAASRRQAEPSEAHPTTLLRSFERVSSSHSSSDAIGYGRRRPRPGGPCLHAEVLACPQTGVTAGVTAGRRGFLHRRIKVTMKTDFVNTQEKEDVPLKVGARPIGKENSVGYNSTHERHGLSYQSWVPEESGRF